MKKRTIRITFAILVMTLFLTTSTTFAEENKLPKPDTIDEEQESHAVISIDESISRIPIDKVVGESGEVGINGVKERYRITTRVVSTKTRNYNVTAAQSKTASTIQSVITSWYISYFAIPAGVASGIAGGIISNMARPYPAGTYTVKTEFLQKVQTSYTTGKSRVIGSGYRVTTKNSKGSYTVTRWS